MPFSKYIEIIRPNYIYLKITPDKSIINEQNTNVVTRAIKSTYKTIFHKIKIEKKKLWFETDFKISYIVDMNKDGASFIFMIPELYYDTLFEKICSIWERCTFEKIDGIDGFSKNAKCYTLTKPAFEKATQGDLRNYKVTKRGFLYFAEYYGEM